MKKIVLIVFIGLLASGLYAFEDEEMLQSFIDGVMFQIDEIEEAWERVNERVQLLTENNEEMQALLNESRQMIEALRVRLASAEEGVIDALENWWYMEGLLDQQRAISDAWARETARLIRKEKFQPVVFGITGAGMAAGGYMLGTGIANQDVRMTSYGVGTIAITGAVYLIGHYVFNWW